MRTALITSFILGLVESKSWSALDSSAPGPAYSPDLAPLAVQYQRRDDSTNHQNDPTLASFQREPPLEGTPQTPNARYRRTRYGPITLQPKSHADELIGNVPKPCTECWITAFQTQVVFKDNRVAQGSDGVELRHMVLYNVHKRDLVCPGDRYPNPARIHASSNQRETSRMNPGNIKYGMQINTHDSFTMSYNITNESSAPKELYIQMIYEAIELPFANGYKEAQMAWIDLQGCSTAILPDKPGAYSIHSPGWKATISGRIISVVGHMSDGGTDLTLLVNALPVCTHSVMYGKKLGFMESDRAMAHITDISVCRRFGHIKEGDEVSISAGFDSFKHPIMAASSHGGMSHLMAMSRMYVTSGL